MMIRKATVKYSLIVSVSILFLGVMFYFVQPAFSGDEGPFTISERTEYGIIENTVYLTFTDTSDKAQYIDNITFTFMDSDRTRTVTIKDFLLNQSVVIDDYGYVNESIGKYKTSEIVIENNSYNYTHNYTKYYDDSNSEMKCDYVLEDKSCMVATFKIIGNHMGYDFLATPNTKEKIVSEGLKIEQKVNGSVPLAKSGSAEIKITMPHTLFYNLDIPYSENKYNITACSQYGCSVLDPTWWNSSWTKMKNVQVQYTGKNATLTGYQTLINVTYAASMQSDFDDLRFVNNSDNIAIPYFILKKVDSTYADVVIKVPIISNTTNTSVDMYYGYASAAAGSNGNTTFEFFDDFGGTALNSSVWWTAVSGSNTITVSDSYLKVYFPSGGFTYASFKTLQEFTIGKKLWIRGNATHNAGGAWSSGSFGFANSTANAGSGGMVESTNIGHWGGTLVLFSENVSGSSDVVPTISYTLSTLQTYLIYWNSTRTEYKCCAEGDILYGYRDNTNYRPMIDIPIGFWGDDNSGTAHAYWVDFYALGKWVDKEPVVSFGVEQAPSVNWWNTTYNYCKNITITHVNVTAGSDLTNFPALVSVSYNAHMYSNYQDLRFVSAGCNNSGTVLDYEIDGYNSTTAQVWVRIPTLAPTTTLISVYYGNTSAVEDGQNKNGVWDQYYQQVYHMSDLTTSTVADSTSLAQTGTKGSANNPLQSSTSMINYSQSFNKLATTKIDAGDVVEKAGDITVEVWWYPYKADATQNNIVSKGGSYNRAGYFLFMQGVTNGYFLWDLGTGSAETQVTGTATFTANSSWIYGAGICKTNTMSLFVNGKSDGTPQTKTSCLTVSDYPFRIGVLDKAELPAPSQGLIDEVRISNTSRSIDWLNQSYRMVANQSSYVSFGTEQQSVDIIAPTYTDFGATVTNNTGISTGQSITYYAKWNDDTTLDKCINSSKINTSGSWTNGTWASVSAGNWTNYTIAFPAEQGSNITTKIYCNDTSGNMNVTGTLFWWNVPISPLWNDTTGYLGSNTTTPIQGDAVLLYAQGKDETALDWAWLETNETGSWENKTNLNMSWTNYPTQIPTFGSLITLTTASYNYMINNWYAIANITYWAGGDSYWPKFAVSSSENGWFYLDTPDSKANATKIYNTTGNISLYINKTGGDTVTVNMFFDGTQVDTFTMASNSIKKVNYTIYSNNLTNGKVNFTIQQNSSSASGTSVFYYEISRYRYYDSPMNMTKNSNWQWSNFTWQNSSVMAGNIVGWRIYYNDTSNNINRTNINTFTIADTTVPTYTNFNSNTTNNTAINTNQWINYYAQWADNIQLDKCVNSSKINTSGSWTNGTWASVSAGNWTNYTIAFPAEQGSNITTKIYCNDTSGNMNVTGTLFWWNVSNIETTPPTYINFNASTTSSGGIWWNTSFSKKAAVNVSINPTTSAYQFKINVTYDSDMNSDFSDLRFTNSSENGELDYWIQEKVNSQYALVWIEANLLSTNGTQAYMYYSCPTCLTTSNGTTTFINFDDFTTNTLAKYRIIGTGTWDSNGYANITSTAVLTGGVYYGLFAVTTTSASNIALGIKYREVSDTLSGPVLRVASYTHPLYGHMCVGSNTAIALLDQNTGWKSSNSSYVKTDNQWAVEETRGTSTSIAGCAGQNMTSLYPGYVYTTPLEAVSSRTGTNSSFSFEGIITTVKSMDYFYVRNFIAGDTTTAIGTEESPTNPTSILANNTAVSNGIVINYYAQWTDNIQLDKCVNSSKINTSGSWTNGTWASAGTGNWTNYTVNFPSEAGSNYTVKIYCNDTSGNTNVTGTFFWWSVSGTCTYPGSGTWSINCADNCVITANTNMNGNAITFYGTGNAYLNANIVNISQRTFVPNCPVVIGTGKLFG